MGWMAGAALQSVHFDSDGIHPNLRGVAYIADAIADAIARAVRSDGTVVEASAATPPSQVAGSP